MYVYSVYMLFAYEHSKEPVLVWDDKIFVQKTYFDNITFQPKNLLFLTLSAPQLKDIWWKDLFVYHQTMTEHYLTYKKILETKKQILPLLRMWLVDESLPDDLWFPMGRVRNISWVHVQNLSPHSGKVEFLQWIGQLGDTKTIPQIRELLFHGKEEDYDMSQDGNSRKDFWRIKRACIETLAWLGAKEVLFEYLLRDPKPRISFIQEAVTGLMQCRLSDQDLPNIMRLIEQHESHDQDPHGLRDYYLYKLFFENPRGGQMRWLYIHGVMQDRDSDAPIQWLVCKLLARMQTDKAVLLLEDIHKHALYREMTIASLIGIKHRRSMQNSKLWNDLTAVNIPLVQRINHQYCNNGRATEVSEWNFLMHKPNLRSAWTDIPRQKQQVREQEYRKQEAIATKQRLAKNAAYFATLQAWDSVSLGIPFSFDGEQIGTVVSNDGTKIVVQSQFHNKHKIWQRSFWIHSGQSCGPACIIDTDGWAKEAYFYRLEIPKARKDTGSSIPQETTILIIGEKLPNPDNELPF